MAETPAEFRERVNLAVDEYIRSSLKWADKQEYKQVPDKRSLHHYVWLAGFQVLGWSRNAIANANDTPDLKGANHAAVSRGVKQLADFIGLVLRPDSAADATQTTEAIRAILKQIARQQGR